jgi:hypothetical protein
VNVLNSSGIPFLPDHVLCNTQDHSAHIMSTSVPVALTLNICITIGQLQALMFMLLHCIAHVHTTFEYSQVKDR